MAQARLTPSVEDYYDKIHRVTWARRTTGMISTGLLGLVYGGTVGAASAFVPYVLNQMGVPGAEFTTVNGAQVATALPTLGSVITSTSLFGTLAAVAALPLGADVGANSSSIAAGLTEKEKREQIEMGLEPAAAPIVTPEKTDPNIIQDGAGAKNSSYYIASAALVTVPLFALFGALLALSPTTASTTLSLGMSGPAAVAASATVFGMFGALMPFKNSMFTNKLSNFFMDVFADKLFAREPEVAVAPQVEHTPPLPAVTQETPAHAHEAAKPERRFADAHPAQTRQHIIDRTETPQTMGRF